MARLRRSTSNPRAENRRIAGACTPADGSFDALRAASIRTESVWIWDRARVRNGMSSTADDGVIGFRCVSRSAVDIATTSSIVAARRRGVQLGKKEEKDAVGAVLINNEQLEMKFGVPAERFSVAERERGPPLLPNRLPVADYDSETAMFRISSLDQIDPS